MMKKCLAFLCMVLLIVPVVPPGRAQEGEYRAVLVGIETYKEINTCLWADDDALAMKDLLSPQWNEVRVLIDGGATKADVREALEWLASEAGEEDVSLFYFAGHGTNDGVNTYICCYDSRNEDYSKDIVDYEFVEMLESVRGQKIVMIDSCHSGGFLYLRSKQSGVARVKAGTPPAELEAGLTEKLGALAIEGYEAMTACAVNEVAWGYPELEHGVFTYFLLEGSGNLNADLDGDHGITTRELFDYAEPKTTEYCGEHPQWWDGVYNTDLMVVF